MSVNFKWIMYDSDICHGTETTTVLQYYSTMQYVCVTSVFCYIFHIKYFKNKKLSYFTVGSYQTMRWKANKHFIWKFVYLIVVFCLQLLLLSANKNIFFYHNFVWKKIKVKDNYRTKNYIFVLIHHQKIPRRTVITKELINMLF